MRNPCPGSTGPPLLLLHQLGLTAEGEATLAQTDMALGGQDDVVEHLDVEQTAARLGKKANAVRVAQHRGLARLRTLVSLESA